MTQNLTGILLVIASMAAFTIEDVFIKQLTRDLPTGQVMIVVGLGGAAIFALLALARRQNLLARQAWGPVPLLRALAEAVAATGFIAALSLVDISVVASVFQVTPLAITMGAALFFGEKVGWRRWLAIALGFVGVLMIIRPGIASFDPYALLTLIAVAGISARDLLTRRLPAGLSSLTVSFQGFLAVCAGGLVQLALAGRGFDTVDGTQSAMLVTAVLFGVLGYYGIVAAMRLADASAVTPFRYTRLLFSLILGMIVFHERPDALTLLGAALIIGTGLYTFLRERQLARRALGSTPLV